MTSSVSVAAASISEEGNPLISLAITMPWIDLEQFLGLKVDRQHVSLCPARPFDQLLNRATMDPYIPPSAKASEKTIEIWLRERTFAQYRAKELHSLGIPEHECRSMLVPFLRRTIVMTAADWWNFRTPTAKISPELKCVTDAIIAAVDSSVPRLLRKGTSHLPFIQDEERDGTFEHSVEARGASAIRCSRGSHINCHGKCDARDDAELFKSSLTNEDFADVPYGVFNFARHIASPYSEDEEIPAPQFKPGRYPGWS